MDFKKKTVLIFDFGDFPERLTRKLEPPNEAYLPLSFYRHLEEGQTLKDFWSYESVGNWKDAHFSKLLKDVPQYSKTWESMISCSPQEYLEKDHPLLAYLMKKLTPEDVVGVAEILVYCDF